MKRIFTLFFLLLALTIDAGSKYYGSFTGDASGLTNLTASGTFSGLNLIPVGAVYTNNADVGFPSYGVSLSSNTLYIYYQEPNSGGLFSGDGGATYPDPVPGGGMWSSYFTVPTNGVYLFVDVNGGSAGDHVLCQIYASNSVAIPVDLSVKGNLSLGVPLAVTNGGTGQSSPSGLASQVGTFFAGTRSTDPWNIFATNVASYAGQIITAEPFGAGQQMFLTIAQSTAAGDNTNSIDIYPGFELIGTPTRMPPLSQVAHMYLGGYLNNTNPANDAEFNLLSINPNASGVFVTFGSYGTNIALGQQTWPGSGFSSITNTLGQKVYLHDSHAMGIGMVPEPSAPGDLPNMGIWVMNGTAGSANSPNFSICNAASPLGSGNYSWIQNNAGNCVVGFPIWVTNVFSSSANGWIWGTVFNLTNGNVNVSSNFYANTATITNLANLLGGFSSVATNTYSVTSGGFTNAGTKEVIARGFTGTTVTFSNKVSHFNFSYGTISTARDIVLLVGESLTGSSCAAAGITDH